MLTLLILALTSVSSYVVYGKPWIAYFKHQRCLRHIARLEYELDFYDVTPPLSLTDAQQAAWQVAGMRPPRIEQWWAMKFIPDSGYEGAQYVMPDEEKRFRRSLARACA